MRSVFGFSELETLMAQDRELRFTLISCSLAVMMYLNLNTLNSPVLGIASSIPYLIINGVFMGHAFFEKETLFLRLTLGILLLFLLLGFVGWLAVIIYNLDTTRFTLALLTAATICSVLNRRVRNKNVARSK